MDWICNSSYSFDDENFRKIFDFYVLKTPVNHVSYRGINLKKRNIRNYKMLYTEMKKRLSSSTFNHFVYIYDGQKIEEEIFKNGIVNFHDENIGESKEIFEYAIYKVLPKYTEGSSFFYLIRCALAHGSFCIHEYKNEKYYYFLNYHKNTSNGKKIIDARMCIKEKTLLEIIKYCDLKI